MEKSGGCFWMLSMLTLGWWMVIVVLAIYAIW